MTALLSARADKAFKSDPVQGAPVLDAGPGRWRIGTIVLANDYATERDFMNMRPNDEVALFTSRVPNTNACTVETLRLMQPHISKAASLMVPDGRIDVVAYSCTSGGVVLGFDAVKALIHAVRPGVHCVTPMSASLAALDRFEARRLAVLTPYVDDVNAVIAEHLHTEGKEVVAFTSFQIEDNETMAAVTPDAILNAALQADRAEADALFISCTAIRAVDVVERIETAIGKPVVTANQAMFWQSLRLARCSLPVPGYGRLFDFET